MSTADDIQPPVFPDPLNGGCAPAAVCSRWMGTGPCGAAGSHHVIWDSDVSNGVACPEHEAEIRQRWVYVGLHPYTAECAATNSGGACWLPSEDRCVIADDPLPDAEAAAYRLMPS